MKYLIGFTILVVAAGALFFTAPRTHDESNELTPSVGTVVVYDDVSISADSTVLDMSGRGYNGSLKAEIRQLTKLEELDISNNNFTGLPAEVGQLHELRVLNLANNPLTGLPYEIGNLQKLELLDLRGTDYSEADLSIIQSSLPEAAVVLTD